MISGLYNALPFILPPVLGAVIGYVTNAIAIRMLFRPLTAKYFFGIRIPFTPGLIPKQRGNLASNIASMVSDELLTEDAIRGQIQSEGFKTGIYNSIASFTENILKAEIGKKKASGNQLPVPVEKGRSIITAILRDFFSSATFSQVLNTIIKKVLHFLFSIDLKDILRRVDSRHVEKLMETLTSKNAEEAVIRVLKKGLNREIETGGKINVLLNDDVIQLISSVIDTFYPNILSSLLEWLNKKSTRDQLENRGKVLLRDVLDKLTAFQRFFISAAQYDRVIEERMPEIVRDVLRRLEEAGKDPKNRKQIIEVAEKALRDFGGKEFQELAFFTDENGNVKTGQMEKIVRNIFSLLGKQDLKEKIAGSIVKRFHEMDPVPVSAVIHKTTGYTEEDAVSFITEKTVLWFNEKGEEISGALYDFVADMFRNMEAKPLGELISLSPERKEKIDQFLSERLVGIIDNKIPQILQSVNFGKIVSDKINGLDMENVEKLLLMVISKHLRWINILGGVLGAFIGALQVVINQLL